MIDFEIDGHLIRDTGSVGKGDIGLLYSGGTWCCHEIVRTGTYHHLVGGRLISLAVSSRLVPFHGREGFGLEVTLTNRCGRPIPWSARPVLEPGPTQKLDLDAWRFYPPVAKTGVSRVSDRLWSGDGVHVHMLYDASTTTGRLEEGQSAKFTVACLLTEEAEPLPGACDVNAWLDETVKRWEKLVDDCTRYLPELTSDIPGLEAYYRRSIATGLIGFWDNPAFDHVPFLAEGGLDGGGICEYLWDTGGYMPQALTLMLGDGVLEVIRRQAKLAVSATAMTPAGTTFGHPYAYNGCAMVCFLATAVDLGYSDKATFEYVRDQFLLWDKAYTAKDGLIDYGKQVNLLEMRGAGWEHTVVSPNVERAWSYEALAQLSRHYGQEPPAEWLSEAESIRKAAVDRLWDDQRGWFKSIYPDGREEYVYSIQVYDAMRAGICTDKMTGALISHLRDGAFLGRYGVSSISREDALHYELNDPDWSGGGAYVGEGPILAQTLWELGYPDLAWDVLSRHFWMGQHLPYYPQEHYCDRPAAPAHKRGNCIAGLSGMQAIIFGMGGVRVDSDGTITCNPRGPSQGQIALHGLILHNQRIDIDICDGRAEVDIQPLESVEAAAI
jgi:hypothetical protein